MGGGLSVLSSLSADEVPVTDPDKCQHKFCEKWGSGHYHCADCHSTIQDQKLIESEDFIINSITDESVAEDGVFRGVSIQFLVDFATSCKCWDMTTRDVRRRFVMPATRSSRCRFVELPEMKPYVGRAGTFVSHAWGARFGDMVAALCDGGADRGRYVWVDIFAVRQWPSHKPDLDFSAVVRQCGSFLVVCSSLPVIPVGVERSQVPEVVRNQISFLRVWCLAEFHTALLSDVAIVVKCGTRKRDAQGKDQFTVDKVMLGKVVKMIDFESAEATLAADKKGFLNGIRDFPGGVEAANEAVRGALIGNNWAHAVVQCAACGDRKALIEALKDPSEHISSAAGCGYVNILRKLIDKGGDVNGAPDGISPLNAAALGGHTECVSLLLKFGAVTNQAELLCSVVALGHTAVVNVLLDNGFNVNSVYRSESALITACKNNCTACARLLLKRGADVNIVNSDGLSALLCATMHPVTLQMLLDCGVDPKSDNSTALTAAAHFGNVECLKILISSGCDLDAKHDNSTALLNAAKKGHTACVQTLISSGCRLDEEECGLEMAIQLARDGGYCECVEMLEQYRK